jgi:hypothetical protein
MERDSTSLLVSAQIEIEYLAVSKLIILHVEFQLLRWMEREIESLGCVGVILEVESSLMCAMVCGEVGWHMPRQSGIFYIQAYSVC